MPLHRRLPKRGFTNIFKKHYAMVNLGQLEKLEGDTFNADRLMELGVVRKLRRRSQDSGYGRADAQDYGGGAPLLEIGAGEDPEGRRHGADHRRAGGGVSRSGNSATEGNYGSEVF